MSTMLPAEDLARRAAELAERVSADPPTSWRPDDPTKGHPPLLVGELVRVDRGHTSYGEKTIAVLRDPRGREWSVWLLATVLADEFRRQAPKLGELVAVRYEGRVTPQGGGAPYAKYRVLVDRQGADVDWHAAGAEAGASSRPVDAAALDEVPF